MNDEFNAAYWASRPPEVRALKTMESFSSERAQAALVLAQKGIAIDTELEAIGWGNPYDTMRYRQYSGYTWFPGLLSGKFFSPGFIPPEPVQGISIYDPNTPAPGSTKVSTDIADFPPFDPPPPVVVPADLPMVGGRILDTMYDAGPGDSQDVPAGFEWSDSRGKFEKVLIVGFAGMVSRYWKKVD